MIDEGAYQLAIADERAYVVGYESIVHIIDISGPLQLRETGTIELPNGWYGVASAATLRHLYLVSTADSGEDRLTAYELTDMDSARERGSVNIPKGTTSIAVDDTFAYLTYGPDRASHRGESYRRSVGGVALVDISAPGNPSVVYLLRVSGNIGGISLAEGSVLVAADGGGLVALELAPGPRPTQTATHTPRPTSTKLPTRTPTATMWSSSSPVASPTPTKATYMLFCPTAYKR